MRYMSNVMCEYKIELMPIMSKCNWFSISLVKRDAALSKCKFMKFIKTPIHTQFIAILGVCAASCTHDSMIRIPDGLADFYFTTATYLQTLQIYFHKYNACKKLIKVV